MWKCIYYHMLSWRELLARMVFMPTTRTFVREWETLLHILLGWVGRSMASMEEFDRPLQGHSSFSAHHFCLALSYLPSHASPWGTGQHVLFWILEVSTAPPHPTCLQGLRWCPRVVLCHRLYQLLLSYHRCVHTGCCGGLLGSLALTFIVCWFRVSISCLL